MLPAPHRLRTATDFTAAMRGSGAVRSGGGLVVVHAHQGGGDGPARVGFVVSKAVGGAVVRNRTKRVLRHLVAARLSGIPSGYDLVVRANPAAATATTSQLAAELDRLLARVLKGRG